MEQGHLLGGGLMWIFWIVVAIVVILFITSFSKSKSSAISKDDEALEILKNRYASGDIDEEEYEMKRKTLNNKDE